MREVSAGIVICDNKILIAQRKIGKSLELCWEFPGGKLEANETLPQCLKRELMEEFSKEVVIDEFFMQSIYNYEFGCIQLNAYFAHTDNTEILVHPDHEQIKWIELSEIDNYEFCPADIPFVEKLKELEI